MRCLGTLLRKAKQSFYNTSAMDMKKLMGDQDHIRENLFAYIQALSPAVRDIFEHFEFYAQIARLAKSGLLYLVTERFAQVDLHPDKNGCAAACAIFYWARRNCMRRYGYEGRRRKGKRRSKSGVDIALQIRLKYTSSVCSRCNRYSVCCVNRNRGGNRDEDHRGVEADSSGHSRERSKGH